MRKIISINLMSLAFASSAKAVDIGNNKINSNTNIEIITARFLELR